MSRARRRRVRWDAGASGALGFAHSVLRGTAAPPPLQGLAMGADISPVSLMTGQSDQPTGPPLVRLLVRDHLDFLRLLDAPPQPEPALY